MICDNISVNKSKLYFAGQDVTELAKKYGTPCYLFDEERIRYNLRVYKNSIEKYFPKGSSALYASKAASFKRIYQIVKEEGLGVDVVSLGELYTAKTSGFNLENAYFHSNNKTDLDIEYAIDNKIGYFVVDNVEEIEVIDRIAREKGIVQKVLLRLTPGIDPHTLAAISTGKVDSKFGSAIETGQAEDITRYSLSLKNIELVGFHCHVGSQVFDSDAYLKAAKIMLEFIAMIEKKYSFKTKELDLGGGYGVRYVEEDPIINIEENIKQVGLYLEKLSSDLHITLPKIHLEPGRSIVADAGMTLYTVGTVKRIPGYKNYVSIDGSMADNPRFALYKSKYTLYLANKMDEEKDFIASVVGRCCESGDIIQEEVKLPSSVKRYDIVAVSTTGAYNYSMASNYNRLQKPPIVMLNNGKSYVAVERESLDDIIKNDI